MAQIIQYFPPKVKKWQDNNMDSDLKETTLRSKGINPNPYRSGETPTPPPSYISDIIFKNCVKHAVNNIYKFLNIHPQTIYQLSEG